jgi:hypothetical protein
VRHQVALLAETSIAVLADKRVLPSVHPQVRRQVALVARAVVAMSTLKGLLSSVQPQVRRQVALVSESRVAVLALVDHHHSTWGLNTDSAALHLVFQQPRVFRVLAQAFEGLLGSLGTSGCKLQGVSVCAHEVRPRQARLLVDAGQWR